MGSMTLVGEETLIVLLLEGIDRIVLAHWPFPGLKLQLPCFQFPKCAPLGVSVS